MTYELNEQYQPIRKYLTGTGMDNYEGHLGYSEITDGSHIFIPDYNQPWYSYMRDQVGTVYKVYSLKTRSIEDVRPYDTFGNLVNQTGTTKTPLGFQGKYYDAESGLNYFYHRYYNPAIGRFTSEDPIGVNGGLNLHNFVNNNPINSTDPKGLITQYIGPGDIPNDIILPTQISLWNILVDTIISYEGTVESGYYSCLTNCLFPYAKTKAIEETGTHLFEKYVPSWFTRLFYKITDARFTAWGAKSLVLVPNTIQKISPYFMGIGKLISIYGWARFDYEIFKCIKECTECPKKRNK